VGRCVWRHGDKSRLNYQQGIGGQTEQPGITRTLFAVWFEPVT
jgi:hypothetical protein